MEVPNLIVLCMLDHLRSITYKFYCRNSDWLFLQHEIFLNAVGKTTPRKLNAKLHVSTLNNLHAVDL